MEINIGKHNCTELWNGVLYKTLSNYPNVTDNEMKDIIDFVNYENKYKRKVVIKADNENIFNYVMKELKNQDKYKNIQRPKLIQECVACPIRKGCLTEFVCHTASLDNAIKIVKSGTLLSAVKARKLSAEKLMKEKRNAANDPKDFFYYVMFSWGNCQAGDRLVMERKLNRFPNDEDLSKNFEPGIRFYFKYQDLKKNPNAINDGFLPIKIKDKVILKDYVYAIIIPKNYENIFKPLVPKYLKDKVFYILNDTKDIWQWSEKVYSFIERLS